MKHLVLLCLLLVAGILPARAEYRDHRGHNVDSLEAVVAAWTPERVAATTDKEYEDLVGAYEGLTDGYQQINGVKSMYYARRLHELAEAKNYLRTMVHADKALGQHFWAREQYDSAAFYYTRALGCVERMAAGEKSLPAEKEYDPETIDDARSGLLGAIGNLYNMMDSLDLAMDYYARAGAIFERYGWNESNSVLWYNIGETWTDEKDYRRARAAYEKSLSFARAAGDSLLAANALKGLGGLYMDLGKTNRALRCLQEADRYYSLHDDQEFRARLENLGFMEKVLSAQKRSRALLALLLLALLLLVAALELLGRRMRRLRREKEAAEEVIDAVLREDPRPSDGTDDTADTAAAADAGTAAGADAGTDYSVDGADPSGLTEREREILPLLAAGLTSQQIADRLYLSFPTIKWYRKRMLSKFKAANTADMIAKAKEQGLI